MRLSKEYLINKLKEFATENGRSPVAADFNNNPEYPSYSAYQRVFGSWNKAIEEAGLSTNYYNRLSDEELLNYLTHFYNENGRVPVRRDFIGNYGYPSYRPYIIRFGSWANALKAVNLDIDTVVKHGIVDNASQKGRKAELMILNHFRKNPIDLAGQNCGSHCDGICPNGLSYDVKSSQIGDKGNGYFHFTFGNKYKEKIEIYYLLAFNKDYTNLMYAWRLHSKIVTKNSMYVAISPSNAKFTTENLKEYDITDRIRNIILS